jgi:peptide/nickel transport system substrate-binding protein
MFEKYTPGQEILMKRNDKYWGPKPQAESVRFIWRNESSVRAAMIKIGEADLTDNIAAQDVDKNATTFRDISYPNAETAFLRMDAMVPPLDDKRLRLALNLAVDRESLRGTVFPKDAIPATNLVMQGIAGYNPNLKVWPYDPAKAKQLFAEAKAAGAPVDKEITLYGRGNLYPNSQESMEALLGMWTAIGFKMKIVMLESANWSKLHGKPFAENRGPSIIQTRHNNQTGDAVFTAESKWGCEGRFSVVCDPALDKMIADATQMQTGPERSKMFQEIFRIAYEEKIVDVPQFHLVGFVRVGPRIDYMPTPLTNNSLEIATVTFK